MAREYNTYSSRVELDISRRYNIWTKSLIAKQVTTSVTRQEFVQVWMDSNLWDQRGKGMGKSTFYFDPSLKHVTINDCKVVLWTRDMVWTKPESEKKSRKKRTITPKPYVKSEKQFLKQLMTAQRNLEKAKAKDKEKLGEADLAVQLFYEKSPIHLT